MAVDPNSGFKAGSINYLEGPNEAAFCGPKIDMQVWRVIGREFTQVTNQVGLAVPKRFGLVYRDRDNTDKTPLCIHRAPLTPHERFSGFLIEHDAGKLLLLFAPRQVRMRAIGDNEARVNCAQPGCETPALPSRKGMTPVQSCASKEQSSLRSRTSLAELSHPSATNLSFCQIQ